MSKGGLVGLLLAAGGGFVAYQYGLFCSFGFGPNCAPPPATPPPGGGATPPPAPGGAATPPPAPTTTPSAPAPGSAAFRLVGPVAPDINNSIKGQVSISGSTMTVNCIPPGTIYNTSGQDITGQLAGQGVDTSALCAAMQNALQAQTVVAGANIPPCASLPRAITSYQSAGLTDPQSVLRLAQLQAALAKCPAGTSGLGLAGPRRRRALYPMRGASRINYVRRA